MIENNMRKRRYIYVWLGHFAVQQKLAQDWKSTKLQLKKERERDPPLGWIFFPPEASRSLRKSTKHGTMHRAATYKKDSPASISRGPRGIHHCMWEKGVFSQHCNITDYRKSHFKYYTALPRLQKSLKHPSVIDSNDLVPIMLSYS